MLLTPSPSRLLASAVHVTTEQSQPVMLQGDAPSFSARVTKPCRRLRSSSLQGRLAGTAARLRQLCSRLKAPPCCCCSCRCWAMSAAPSPANCSAASRHVEQAQASAFTHMPAHLPSSRVHRAHAAGTQSRARVTLADAQAPCSSS